MMNLKNCCLTMMRKSSMKRSCLSCYYSKKMNWNYYYSKKTRMRSSKMNYLN